MAYPKTPNSQALAVQTPYKRGEAVEVFDQVELVAAAGTVVGDATALPNAPVVIVVGADDAAGVKLPASGAGKVHCILTITAAKTLMVYPETGCTINGGSANASIELAALSKAKFRKISSTEWEALYSNGA